MTRLEPLIPDPAKASSSTGGAKKQAELGDGNPESDNNSAGICVVVGELDAEMVVSEPLELNKLGESNSGEPVADTVGEPNRLSPSSSDSTSADGTRGGGDGTRGGADGAAVV